MQGHKPMKDRITLTLCTQMRVVTERKIKPLPVYHSDNAPAFQTQTILKEKLLVMRRANPKAWVARQFVVDWINLVVGPSIKIFLQEHDLPLQALLVLDNAPARSSSLENDILEDFSFIRVLIIPHNTTPLLQPTDQKVIYNFKNIFTKHLLHRCFDVTEHEPYRS